MAHEALGSASGLHDLIVEHRGETENSRRLAQPIVDALIENKLCRMALPESSGGLGMKPTAALEVYEKLATAEASVAWVVWNNALVCFFARFMPPRVREEVFGDPRNLFANSTRPEGRAVPHGESYHVRGRWSLVSGCLHAQWIPVMCMVEKHGEIEMLAPNVPHMRMAIVPRDHYEIIDTWYVGGLRGTGSHDAVLADEIVPNEKTFPAFSAESLIDSPLGRVPIAVTMSGGCAAICLGIARATQDALIDLARSRVTPGPQPDLRDRKPTQAAAARTRTRLNALRAHLVESHEKLWDESTAQANANSRSIADAWSASITTATECRRVVNEIYDVTGTASLYVDSPIERAHRDIHAVLKHIILQSFWLEEAGRVHLGLEPENPLFAL